MGKRGPKPKPTKLKIIAGNPGKRSLNKREPQPPADEPSMPAWLSSRAKIEWKRIVPELKRLGLLTAIDLAALACYCQAFAEFEIATRTIDEEGRVCSVPLIAEEDLTELVTDPKTGEPKTVTIALKGQRIGARLKTHPAVTQQREAFRIVKQFLAEFGLSPSSRSGVSGQGSDAGTVDPRGSKFFGSA